MQRLMRRLFDVLPLALALVACESVTPDPATPHQSPGVANLQPQDDDAVAERAAEARCDRANACREVGAAPTRGFESREACMRIMHQRAARDIQPSACERGVDAKQIDRCIGEIVAERCGDPYANFAHFGACRPAAICRVR